MLKTKMTYNNIIEINESSKPCNHEIGKNTEFFLHIQRCYTIKCVRNMNIQYIILIKCPICVLFWVFFYLQSSQHPNNEMFILVSPTIKHIVDIFLP